MVTAVDRKDGRFHYATLKKLLCIRKKKKIYGWNETRVWFRTVKERKESNESVQSTFSC